MEAETKRCCWRKGRLVRVCFSPRLGLSFSCCCCPSRRNEAKRRILDAGSTQRAPTCWSELRQSRRLAEIRRAEFPPHSICGCSSCCCARIAPVSGLIHIARFRLRETRDETHRRSRTEREVIMGLFTGAALTAHRPARQLKRRSLGGKRAGSSTSSASSAAVPSEPSPNGRTPTVPTIHPQQTSSKRMQKALSDGETAPVRSDSIGDEEGADLDLAELRSDDAFLYERSAPVDVALGLDSSPPQPSCLSVSKSMSQSTTSTVLASHTETSWCDTTTASSRSSPRRRALCRSTRSNRRSSSATTQRCTILPIHALAGSSAKDAVCSALPVPPINSERASPSR